MKAGFPIAPLVPDHMPLVCEIVVPGINPAIWVVPVSGRGNARYRLMQCNKVRPRIAKSLLR